MVTEKQVYSYAKMWAKLCYSTNILDTITHFEVTKRVVGLPKDTINQTCYIYNAKFVALCPIRKVRTTLSFEFADWHVRDFINSLG